MNSRQILHAVEYGMQQFGSERDNQIKYLMSILYFLELDMRNIELYEGMSLDEHIRFYELDEAIANIKYQIASLKVHKPVAKFSKIDEDGFRGERE